MDTITTATQPLGPPAPDRYVFSGPALHPFVQHGTPPIGRCSHCHGTRAQHTSVAIAKPAQRVTAKPEHREASKAPAHVSPAKRAASIVDRIDLSKFNI